MILNTSRFVCAIIGAILLIIPVSARADAVDDYLKDEMARRQIPGVAIAVVQEGKLVKLAGYGLANIEHNIPVTPKTVFQIQSVTKTFTSTAILMLAEEKKLSLEDPVSRHLADVPETWKDIAVRHLLSHTSGIKDFINEPTASLRQEVSEADVFKAAVPRPLNFKPGDKYAYSNTNYHLLAMIIRKQTGKSYGEFLAERIFTPLGMASTRIMSASEIIPNRAAGYVLDGKTVRNGHFVAESILAYGGGGVVSTAEDMAKWAMTLGTEKLLKKPSIDAAWAPTPLTRGTSAYGLGWMTGTVKGHAVVNHTGAHMTGFTSCLLHVRDHKLTVVVLTNARHGTAAKMAQVVAEQHLPAPATR